MGIFVTIDGPNGAGKSTFINHLKEKLYPKTVYSTREPSSTKFGEFVKNNEGLLKGKSYAYLIAADRCNHVENEIIPSLEKYDIVLCDRYVESSLVLQRYDGVDIGLIWKLNEDFRKPDISVILLAKQEHLQNRLSQRNSLSAFEQVISRDEEIKLYKEANIFLQNKGYNTLILQNDNEEQLWKNISVVINRINE